MMLGKNLPSCVCALCILVECILEKHIKEKTTYEELMVYLETRLAQSRTVKHWTDNLIKPILLVLAFIRAEREGDWLLHISTLLRKCLFTSWHLGTITTFAMVSIM